MKGLFGFSQLRKTAVPLSMAAGLAVFWALKAQEQAKSPPAAQTVATNPSQPELTTLEPGKTVARELAGSERHAFHFALSQGQTARIAIDHGASDLTLRLADPQGNIEFETTTRPREAVEAVDVVAGKTGRYQIQIELKCTKAPAARYRIQIDSPHPASEAERGLYEARRQYSESWNLYERGDYDKAQAAAHRSLELREKFLGSDAADVGRSLNRLGVIFLARDDYNHADELFERALTLAEKAYGKDSLEAADVTANLARNASAKGNYAEAERLARSSLEVREKALGPDHYMVAASLVTLGEVLLDKAEYAAARPVAERALETANKLYSAEDLPNTAAVSLMGRVQARLGNFGPAEQLLLQNLHNREVAAGPDSLPVANALQDLQSLYVFKIENLKSQQMGERALALKERILGPDHLQVSFILHNLALISYRRRDYDTAERLYLRALVIKERVLGPDHPMVAVTVNNLGLLYWQQLQLPKAAEFFKRTLAIEEKTFGPESLEASYPLANLGIIAKQTGDHANAEIYYKRALAIREKVLGPNHPEIGTVLESLGILYRDEGKYAEAEPYLLRTLDISNASRGPDHPENLRILRNLSQLYEAEGEVAKALAVYERLDALEEKNLPLNLAAGSERQKLAYFDPFLSSMEKMISFQIRGDPDSLDARKLAATAVVYRKGRVLDSVADSFNTLWNRSSPEDREVLDRLKDVTTQLAALVLNGPKQLSIAEQQRRIQDLTAQREQLEGEVARRSLGFYEASQAGTLAAIQTAIPARTVLIEFGVYSPYDAKQSFESDKDFGDPRYIAYVIPSRGDVQARDLGPAKEIDAAVSALREGLRDPGRRDVRPLARALYDKILKPLRVFVADANHLLVSPDGQLDLIPFETLVDEQGRYLVERYSVSYLTTGRDLLRMQVARASRSGPLVIADPAFGEPGNTLQAKVNPGRPKPLGVYARRSITTGKDLSDVYFAPLGGTAQEARLIQSLFPDAKVLTGQAASKAALKQANAPSILHIATHGFFLQNPGEDAAGQPPTNDTRAVQASPTIENPLLRSGLALSGANLTKSNNENGILTALEAANLNLWGTKLVTLSACETGVGDVRNGEGVYGLRRAFVLAGTESLVMSLWPVSDYVTREMMTAYYTGLKNGLGRGEALRQAELAMMKRKGREHPFYWASFIESGEWANLDGQR